MKISSPLQAVKVLLRDERGSASVEMVIFALPLFLPLIFLASHVAHVSASKIEISQLARTSLRAFVTSPSTALGHARVEQVLQLAEGNSGAGDFRGSSVGVDSERSIDSEQSKRFTYQLECRNLPCIQPLNRVRITITDRVVGTEVAASLSTDQWIKGEAGYRPSDSRTFFGYRDVADIEEETSPFLEAKEFIDKAKELLDLLPSKK